MPTADELAAIFAATCPASLPSKLGVTLVELSRRAHRTYPGLGIDDRELVTALAANAPRTASANEIDDYLARSHPACLAIATLARGGSPLATAQIERAYRLTIDSACRRYASSEHTAQDLKALLHERLFVVGKIGEYAGQGRLEDWLRVTAVRMFLDASKQADAPLGELAHGLVKTEFRELVASALGIAVDKLQPGDRHLLRQHLVAGLTIDQLGAVLGIHRATAARRIVRAKDHLVAGTRREVAQRLQRAVCEVDEVVGLVADRLDATIARLLA